MLGKSGSLAILMVYLSQDPCKHGLVILISHSHCFLDSSHFVVKSNHTNTHIPSNPQNIHVSQASAPSYKIHR